jgi:hypothetical protein
MLLPIPTPKSGFRLASSSPTLISFNLIFGDTNPISTSVEAMIEVSTSPINTVKTVLDALRMLSGKKGYSTKKAITKTISRYNNFLILPSNKNESKITKRSDVNIVLERIIISIIRNKTKQHIRKKRFFLE